jgi:hypothetical protein
MVDSPPPNSTQNIISQFTVMAKIDAQVGWTQGIRLAGKAGWEVAASARRRSTFWSHAIWLRF